MNDKKFDAYVREVADKLIEQIQNGTAPWQKPWDGVMTGPINALTNRPYRGINSLLLLNEQMTRELSDPRWLTYKQAESLGANVKKGEHGVPCIYWKVLELEETDKNKSNDETDLAESDSIAQTKRVFIPCRFTVFHISQFDNLKLPEYKVPEYQWSPVERAETILKNSRAEIREVAGDRAFYSPDSDSITLPMRTQFQKAEDFYDTALHELGHWTGHVSRLNRDLSGGFGSESYAKEELNAEIASMMVAMNIGLPHNTQSHASYVEGWVKALRSDPREIFRASAVADKIKDYLLQYEKQYFYAIDFQTESVRRVDTEEVIRLARSIIKTDASREAFEELITLETHRCGDPDIGLFEASCKALDPNFSPAGHLPLCIENKNCGLFITTDILEAYKEASKMSFYLTDKLQHLVAESEGQEVAKGCCEQWVKIFNGETKEIQDWHKSKEIVRYFWMTLETPEQRQRHDLVIESNVPGLSEVPTVSFYYFYDFESKQFAKKTLDELEIEADRILEQYPDLINKRKIMVKSYIAKDMSIDQARYKALRNMLDPTTALAGRFALNRIKHPGFVITDNPSRLLLEASLPGITAKEKADEWIRSNMKTGEEIIRDTDNYRKTGNWTLEESNLKINAESCWKTLNRNDPTEQTRYWFIDYELQTVGALTHSELIEFAKAKLASEPQMQQQMLELMHDRGKNANKRIGNDLYTIKKFLDPSHDLSSPKLLKLKSPGYGIYQRKEDFIDAANFMSPELGEKAVRFCCPNDKSVQVILREATNYHVQSALALGRGKNARYHWRQLEKQLGQRLFQHSVKEQAVLDLNRSYYLIDYEKNEIRLCKGIQALEDAKIILASVAPSNSRQERALKEVFSQNSQSRIEAINSLLDPSTNSPDSICLEAGNKGMHLCRDPQDLMRYAAYANYKLYEKAEGIVRHSKLDTKQAQEVISKHAQYADTEEFSKRYEKTENTFRLIEVMKNRNNQQLKERLLNRFPHATDNEIKEVRAKVKERFTKFVRPLMEYKQKLQSIKKSVENKETHYEFNR